MTGRHALGSTFIRRGSVIAAVCAVMAASVWLSSDGNAQSREREKATNLKVLDTAISHDELISIMGDFSSALGVHCDYCHAKKSDGPGFDMDFASDKVPTKVTAREMMLMTQKINGDFIGKLTNADTPRVQVQCVTCHRGQAAPILIQDVLTKVRAERGMAGVDSVYRALREKYYGSATYDFSDAMLVHFAMDISQESDTNALMVLLLNREFNPKSAFNEWALGQTYASLGDTTQAIATLKHALELNPNNRRAQRDLESLQGKSKP
jgi:hypothetical protein